MFGFIVACGKPEPVEEPPPPPPPPVPSPVRRQVVVSGDDAVVVGLQFRGVSNQYQRFFSDEAMVSDLALGLAACGNGAVDIVVSYSNETRIGSIVLSTTPKDSPCVPSAVDGGYDLSVLTPVGVALAEYRDALSANYDIRLLSFKTGVSYLAGTNLCTLYTGGQYPPDGSTWSRCPEFAGNETCAAGDRTNGVTVLGFSDPEHHRYLARCFLQ